MDRIMVFSAGATRTRAGLYDRTGRLLGEAEGPGANAAELGVARCAARLAGLGRTLLPEGKGLARVAAAVAGAFHRGTRAALAEALAFRFGGVEAVVSDDRWPLLRANAGGTGPAVLVTAGTGSSVLARGEGGRCATAGGRGTLLGDEGSAYGLAVDGLRTCARAADGWGRETGLLSRLTAAAGVSDFEALQAWTHGGGKEEIARLAPAVIAAAAEGDRAARAILRRQAGALARQVRAAAARLGLPVEAPLFYTGGLVEGSPLFLEAFRSALEVRRPGFRLERARIAGHAAVFQALGRGDPPASGFVSQCRAAGAKEEAPPALPPTEARLPGVPPLDRLPVPDMVRVMIRSEAAVHEALAGAEDALVRAVEAAARTLAAEGRIVYAGAGTSGRLGVLDAAECPPTFGVEAERVLALLAGGEEALRHSREGAEDDAFAGASDLAALQPAVGTKDLVVGITASGRTPYVAGVLAEAARRGAKTALLCCNPAPGIRAEIELILDTGAEVMPGSTRLKAGSAVKAALNILSTCAMTRAGRVYEGYMAGMRASNAKLRRRAARIVQALCAMEEAEAFRLVDAAGGRTDVAVVMARLGIGAEAAAARLEAAGGSLHRALGEECP